MSFCDELCLLCSSSGKIYVNLSRFHKVCEECIPLIGEKITANCIHCKAKLLLVKDFFSCSSCGFGIPDYKCSENHLRCVNCSKYCTQCLRSKCEICQNQLENACIECRKINMQIFADKMCSGCFSICFNKINKPEICKNCGGKFCRKCSSAGCLKSRFKCGCNGCPLCLQTQTCNKCKSISNQTFQNKRHQIHEASSPNLISAVKKKDFPVSAMSSKTLDPPRRQNSKSFCESSNHCSTCQINQAIVKKPCGHWVCASCVLEEACSACELPNLSVQCDYCHINSPISLKKLKCNHSICLDCSKNEKQCPCCEQYPGKCETCKTRGLVVRKKCDHPMCQECIRKRTWCKMCFKYNCEKCGTKVNEIFMNKKCLHKLCVVCYSKTSEGERCSKCQRKFCPNCFEVVDEFTKFECEHLGCYKCSIDSPRCYNCAFSKSSLRNPQQSYITGVCFKCNFNDTVCKLFCGDSVCFKCQKKYVASEFNYSCIICCLTKQKICVTCKKLCIWELIDDKGLLRKNCCDKVYCMYCLKIRKGLKKFVNCRCKNKSKTHLTNLSN